MSVSVSGGNDEVGPSDLTGLIEHLAPGEALIIAEFGADELTRWGVRADRCGTPRVTYDSVAWTALRRHGALHELALARFLAPEGARLLLAMGAAAAAGTADAIGSADIDVGDAARALQVVSSRYQARLLTLGAAASVDDLLGEATARVPLSQWYELLCLERTPSGHLKRVLQQLFEPGAQRRATRTFQVRCEPSSPAGTTFAVLARSGPRTTGLVSMASAKLEPGSYTVTATLQRPGLVSFDGLPVKLHQDTRSWPEVDGTVPGRVGKFGPAHLIVAVETCGSEDQVAGYLDRAGQLIRNVVTAAEGPVRFSMIAYGAHPHNLRFDDDPVKVLAWADRDQTVLSHLALLRERARVRQDRYSRAASIECMLAEVARLLQVRQGRTGEGHPAGRPVLVTVGSRVAFPAYQDPYSEILPCPLRNDWQSFYRWLREDHREMAFGAICGGDHDAEVWRLLGAEASAELVALDAWHFATALRLLRPPDEYVPFPMIDR
jgi:hypothetical protein